MVNEIDVQKQKIFTGFVVDVELFITTMIDETHFVSHFNNSVAALILGHVMHKNKNLRKPCNIIFRMVADALETKKSGYIPTLTMNYSKVVTISGYHFHADHHFATDVIYEMLNFEGILDGNHLYGNNKNELIPCPLHIQYTITFLFTPAVYRAWHIYKKKGYNQIRYRNEISKEIMAEIESKKDFDHNEIWDIICKVNTKPSTQSS